jgi:hypothetical protein
VNLGKRGLSATIGGWAARVTAGPSGTRFGSSLRGTGLYYSNKVGTTGAAPGGDSRVAGSTLAGQGEMGKIRPWRRGSRKVKIGIAVGVLALVGAIAGAVCQEDSTGTTLDSFTATSINALVATTAVAPTLTTGAPTTSAMAASSTTAGRHDGVTVYITDSGEKYHREGCSSLAKSKIPISLSDAIALGYEPCLRCNPPE